MVDRDVPALAVGQVWRPTREQEDAMRFESYSATNGATDQVHIKLRKIIERRTRDYLWTPQDMISFKPALLPNFYGDGRALFRFTTINQRPRYYVIRGNSDWGCSDQRDAWGPEFGDFSDCMMTEIEEAFGRGRCGYSGNSLFWPKRERLKNCKCEECSDRFMSKWPELDDYGGCSWSRMDWPSVFSTVKNPVAWYGNLLDTGVSTAWITRHRAVLDKGGESES